jgi:YHS domain-containing protein
MSANTAKAKMIDPVCGMEVDPSTAATETCHEGMKVYFCAEGCRDAFLANPERYAKPKRKGFWQRYLARMEKATGGKPMKCH